LAPEDSLRPGLKQKSTLQGIVDQTLIMIKFSCPLCNEKMEIDDEMVGRKVPCIRCDELIEVPEPIREQPAAERFKTDKGNGLSSTEFLLFGLLFFFIPFANVIVSSVLYYIWRADQPRRANQINMLGFAVFFCNLAILFLTWIVQKL
jgi:hypothetical protein